MTLISVSEAVRRLGVSRLTVYRWIWSGFLDGAVVVSPHGRRLKLDWDELKLLLEARKELWYAKGRKTRSKNKT